MSARARLPDHPPHGDASAGAASGREDELERMARWLRPLASPMRLRLLRYLTRPHYLEEVASHLKLTRQAARKHVDKLAAIGVLERRPGVRETGPVVEYVISPQALFLLYDEFEKLGSLRRDAREDDGAARTLAGPSSRAPRSAPPGPCFWVVRGLDTGHRVALPDAADAPWTMGRDARCDFVVAHDPYASARHAEVRREGPRYVLQDLRSTNGTLHNWAQLPRGGAAPLRHGDVVGVGKTLLLYWGP